MGMGMGMGMGMVAGGAGLSALEQRLRMMESNYAQRERELNSLAASAARMPMELGMTQQMGAQQGQAAALAMSAKSAEVAAMQSELNELIREVENASGRPSAVRY
jgi:hypothetical protein